MNPMQQLLIQSQKLERERKKLYAELEAKEFTTKKAGLVTITVKGSREVVSINIEPDGFEADNKEMVEELIVTGLNELFAQISEEEDKIEEKVRGGF